MPNILHLAHKGSSIPATRLTKLTNDYSKKYRARCMQDTSCNSNELQDRIDWADIVHVHTCSSFIGLDRVQLKNKIVITQNFSSEMITEALGITAHIAATPNFAASIKATYLVPDALDVTDAEFAPNTLPRRGNPIVRLTSRDVGNPFYKQVLMAQKELGFIVTPNSQYSPEIEIEFRRGTDISVDITSAGSYSTMDYLATGIPVFAPISAPIKQFICSLVSMTQTIPWIPVNRDVFLPNFLNMIHTQSWKREGAKAREWMKNNWHPNMVMGHYEDMYNDLLQ